MLRRAVLISILSAALLVARGYPQDEVPSAEAATCSGAPVLGGVCTNTITPAGQTHQYVFFGTAGDRLLLRLAKTSGAASFTPRVAMSTGGGAEICSAFGTQTEVICTLSATATYDILLRDFANTNTGSYSLYAQRTNNPGGSESLQPGTAQTDTIELGGAYTYRVNLPVAGTHVLMRSTSLTAGLAPHFRIFNPDGSLMCSTSGASYAEDVCTTLAGGQHTVLVNDLLGADGGSAATFVQTLPADGEQASVGGTVVGDTVAGQFDTYSLQTSGATAYHLLRAVSFDGSYQPDVRVYNEQGIQECGSVGAVMAEMICDLSISQAYTILVGDQFGEASGDYALYIQNVSFPENPRLFDDGEVWQEQGETAHLTTLSQSFNAGEWMYIQVTRLDGGGQPEVRVLNQQGLEECSQSGALTVEMYCFIANPGAYGIYIGDVFGDDPSSYAVHTRRLNWNGGAIPTLRETTRRGTLMRFAESQFYEFAGQSGDTYAVTVDRTSGAIQPHVRFVRPNGSPSCEASGAGTATTDCALDATGTWRIVVSDVSANAAGAFSMFLTCKFCPALPADADADGVSNAADVCPTVPDPAQANTDAAPLDIPGAAYDDTTRPHDDNSGDACDTDDDNDGLLDLVETSKGCGVPTPFGPVTNPLVADTDGDRSQDLYECIVGTGATSAASKPNPASLGGADNDQLPDEYETFFGSAGNDLDSDDDGISDGVEIRGHFASPAHTNTDGDICPDDIEIASINTDTVVSAIDLNQVAQRFFVTTAPAFDLNKDGTVNALDLSLQAQNFNLTPCQAPP